MFKSNLTIKWDWDRVSVRGVKLLSGDYMYIPADWCRSSRYSFWKITKKKKIYFIKKPRHKYAKWLPSDLTPWTLTLDWGQKIRRRKSIRWTRTISVSSCFVSSSVDSNKNVPSKLGGDEGANEKSNLFSIFNRCFLCVKLFIWTFWDLNWNFQKTTEQLAELNSETDQHTNVIKYYK